jgi:transposase
MNGERFADWFKKDLVKSVPRKSAIILDRAAFHRKKKPKGLARRHGARVLFLPANSLDLNPIEKTRANIKRETADILRVTDDLVPAISQYFLRYP